MGFPSIGVKIPTNVSPIIINLNLKEKGVIITVILENKPEKIKKFHARIEQQIEDLNEQVDYLSEIIASIQGFFGSIFG